MDEENLILKSWLQQKKVFIDNLIISRKRPTKDSVHDLRVAVKKMRSYLRLNEEFTKEDWRPSFSGFKRLFRSFGRLRDLDMSLELTREAERKWQLSLGQFKQYLATNRSLTRRWAKQAARDFNEQQSIFDFRFNFFTGLSVADATEKILILSKEKIKKTKRLKKHFDKHAHEIRKLLKDVLYWIKICPKEDSEKNIDGKALDRLLKLLGAWQDQFIYRRTAIQYSKAFDVKGPEKDNIRALLKNIGTDQHDLLSRSVGILGKIENHKQP